jgi:HPt (histidine-containing phosphotransfer) domain-containing protein
MSGIAGGSAIFDNPRFQELRRDFIARAEAQARDLRAAADVGDWGKVRSIAHKLAGSAGLFGFADIGTTASALEEEIDTGAGWPTDRGRLHTLLNQLDQLG